ncbi:glycerophosphodiester phosphodiesterase family protein [Flavobacteriaceae bacterium 14752]|uniref:glycerophosphodiester phosphodiesterase family protein n=1 Tax=Mesohalobacter salilacus TaxID=2491711 RepID=UPI000F641C7A|nr:glycerophosphodiester phosphodiesterase [Flavobacteriaceae bacterium 14752]
MKNYLILFTLSVFSIGIISCKKSKPSKPMALKSYTFDLQGHRGARGILPENSLQAFQKAIDLGVNTLELDVVVSKDSLIVVSHDPYMNPKICLNPQGQKISDKPEFNLYKMTYDEIQSFDCGSQQHSGFPKQKTMTTYKPLLSEVIQMTTDNLREKGRRVSLNIELKSSPDTDHVYHPKPDVFVDLVMKTIKSELIPLNKINIQSFDKRIIQYVIDQYPRISTAYLVEEGNFYDNLEDLGRTPQIYSPIYTNVDSLDIKRAHDSGVKVIPWTVNEISDMQNLLELGVDGIITDYPNRAKALHKS